MKAGQRLAGGDTNGDAKTNTGRIMSVKKLGEAELEQLRLQLEELFRNYDVSLDLIPKATMPDELIDRILDEYIGRFEEIPGQDVLSLHQGDGELTAREKLKGLLMFSSQAVLLHENARVYQELADANRRLSEMAEKLRRKNEELEKLNSQYLSMLGFVSHELRSPLVSILGFAELLDDGVLGELTKEQRDAVAIISKVSRNLIDMIKNYLDLARIENGRLPLNRTRLDVESEVVQPLVREMAEQLAARNMKIQPARPEVDRTLDLWADPELLRIVFTNLFSNAIRYGEPGTTILYDIVDRGDEYEFSVFNRGPGVQEDKLPYLFTKFVDIPKENTKERGTGLGLYNTRCIVESHGGRIWAESKYGEYFKVTFTLPKGQPEEMHDRVRLAEDVQVETIGRDVTSKLAKYREIHEN